MKTGSICNSTHSHQQLQYVRINQQQVTLEAQIISEQSFDFIECIQWLGSLRHGTQTSFSRFLQLMQFPETHLVFLHIILLHRGERGQGANDQSSHFLDCRKFLDI